MKAQHLRPLPWVWVGPWLRRQGEPLLRTGRHFSTRAGPGRSFPPHFGDQAVPGPAQVTLLGSSCPGWRLGMRRGAVELARVVMEHVGARQRRARLSVQESLQQRCPRRQTPPLRPLGQLPQPPILPAWSWPESLGCRRNTAGPRAGQRKKKGLGFRPRGMASLLAPLCSGAPRFKGTGKGVRNTAPGWDTVQATSADAVGWGGRGRRVAPQLPSSLLSLRPVFSSPNPKRSESFFSLKEGAGGLGGGGGWTGPASSSVTSERSSRTGNSPWRRSGQVGR